MAGKEFSAEETVKILSEKAQQDGDSFRIKIWRFDRLSQQAAQIATFGDAVLAHVTTPEMWVPQLAGGGQYAFHVFHLSDPISHIGGPLKFSIEAEPRALDTNAHRGANWNGPKTLLFPQSVPQQNNPNYAVASPSNPTGAASQTNVPGGQNGAPHVNQQLQNDPSVANKLAEFQLKMNELQASQRAVDDEKRHIELERMRHEHVMQLRELESRITQSQVHAAPKGNDLRELIAVVAPVVQTLLQSQAEMRQVVFKMEAARAEQSQLMLMKMMDRPSIDPAVQLLFEKMSNPNQGAPQMEMVTHMTELTMNMIDRMADSTGGQENPWIAAAKEFSKGLGALVGGMRMVPPKRAAAGAPKPAGPIPGLPAGAVPQVLPQAPQNGAAYAGLPGTQPTGNGAVPIQNFQASAQHPEVQAPPAPPQQEPQAAPPVIDQLIAAIKAYTAPELVAQAVLKSLNDPGFTAELNAVNGEVHLLAAKYLTEWINEDGRNEQYVNALLQEIEKQGRAAGIFDDGEAEGDSDEEEGEEAAAE